MACVLKETDCACGDMLYLFPAQTAPKLPSGIHTGRKSPTLKRNTRTYGQNTHTLRLSLITIAIVFSPLLFVLPFRLFYLSLPLSLLPHLPYFPPLPLFLFPCPPPFLFPSPPSLPPIPSPLRSGATAAGRAQDQGPQRVPRGAPCRGERGNCDWSPRSGPYCDAAV